MDAKVMRVHVSKVAALRWRVEYTSSVVIWITTTEQMRVPTRDRAKGVYVGLGPGAEFSGSSSLNNLLVSPKATPNRLAPHLFFLLRAFFSPNPIPQTRSLGLASTMVVSRVSRSFWRMSGFWRNLRRFPSRTIRERCFLHTASSKLWTRRPSFLTPRRAGLEVESMDDLACDRDVIEEECFVEHHPVLGGWEGDDLGLSEVGREADGGGEGGGVPL